MKYSIEHNIKHNRFEAIDEINVLLGNLSYELKESTLTVTHTIVEPEYEGQGIAGALNKAVLLFAKENGYHVIPLCSYTKNYIDRHPEFQDLI